MAILTVQEKINKSGQPISIGQIIIINAEKLVGVETKSLKVVKGFMHDRPFLTQSDGHICPLDVDCTIQVSSNLFNRILILAQKAAAI